MIDFGPCRSKNACVLSMFSCLNRVDSGRRKGKAPALRALRPNGQPAWSPRTAAITTGTLWFCRMGKT